MTDNNFDKKKFIPITLKTSVKNGSWLRLNINGHFEYYKIGEYFDKPKGYEIKRDGFSTAGLILTLSIEDLVKRNYEIMLE